MEIIRKQPVENPIEKVILKGEDSIYCQHCGNAVFISELVTTASRNLSCPKHLANWVLLHGGNW